MFLLAAASLLTTAPLMGQNTCCRQAKSLHLGDLTQGKYTASGTEHSRERVVMHDVLAVPTYGASLKFILPKGIAAAILHGAEAKEMTQETAWMKNGDTVTLPKESNYYRVCFARSNGKGPITVQEVRKACLEGKLDIIVTNHKDELSVIGRNYDCEKYVKAMMIDTKSARSLGLHTYPTILHGSDPHGDFERTWNLYEYAEYLGANMVCLTGDHAANHAQNGARYIEECDSLHNIKTFVCTGNHDVNYQTQNAEIYQQYIKYFKEKYGYSCNRADDPQGTPYYMYDDTLTHLRMIAINLYDGGHPEGKGVRCNVYSTQMLWFCQVLAQTPAGYGVIVMMHAPESMVESRNGSSGLFKHRTFGYWKTHPGMSGTPFADIVDAFIGRTTVTTEYVNTDHNGKESKISIKADFSRVAQGAEFIAYLCGHEHEDAVGYLEGAKHKQLMLDVTCTCAVYGPSSYSYLANLCDMPRGPQGSVQDAFNLYVIDRANKCVRIGRIGSNFSIEKLAPRQCMVIRYADSEAPIDLGIGKLVSEK